MAKQIDERVVSMQFDNQKFEKNVSVTLHSLENLKGKLSGVGDAVKNIGNLDKTAKKADFTPLANSVEAVRVKFSALEIMGITALTNITNSAVNAGKRIAKALAFDSISTGFSEYETKINSVQTIMSNTASKGKTMEDVTRVLDELNTYADKTIYNFAEMTKNIGTFTAAGVDLEDSAKAIQGIANLAASSGSTSQQASTAMYQLSQALAAGTVKLMDWNSVVNAGMGGEKFQNALKQTAREHGIAVDKIIKKQGSFRESLSEGWISADILNETLNKFTVDGANKYANAMLKSGKYTKAQADALIKEAHAMEDAATKVKTFTQLWDTMKESAQSGWAQTWELIVGDFEEAKEFFSEISEMFGKVIGDSANARNKLIGDAMGSKWETLSEKITKAGISTDDFMKKLKSTAKSSGIPIDKLIKKYGSLEKVIKAGKIPVDVFVKTLKKFAGATEQTSKSTDKVTKKVENLEKVVKQVINGDFGNGEKRMKALAKAGYDYATVQDLVNKTLKGEKVNYDKLSDSQLKNMGYTKDQVKAIRQLAKEAEKSGTPINELIKDLEKPSGRELLLNSLINSLKGVGNILGTIKKAWRDTFAPMSSDSLYNIVEGLNEITSKFKKFTENKDTIDKLTRTFKGLFAILDIISTFTTGALKFAIKTLGKILGIADLDVLSITASIGDMLVAFRDWLLKNNAVVKGINKFSDVAKDAVKFIGGLVKSFLELPGVQRVMSLFSNAVKKSFGGVGDYLTEGIDRFRDFIDRSKSLDGGFNLDNLKAIFKDFKDNVFDYFFDFDKMFDNVQKNFEEFKEKSKYHLEKAGDGFSWFIKKLKELADTVRKETDFGSIVAMGMGVGLLSIFKKFGDALETLSDIAKGFDMTPITKGVGNVLNRFADMEKAMAFKIKVKAIQGLVVAIVALAGAVAVLTKLDQDKLWSSVIALVVLMGVMAGLAFAISKMDAIQITFSKGSQAFLALAGGVMILATSLKIMDGLNSDKLGKNVLALVIILIALTAAAGILGNKVPQLSKGTGALIAMAIAVKIMASSLDTISKIDSNEIDRVLLLLGTLIGSMIALSKACTGINKGSGLSILAAVIALKLLIGVIDDIADIDLNKIKNNMGAFVLIFAAFVGVMWAASKAGSKSVGAGIGVIAMAASLLLIIKAIKLIDEIDDATLDRSLKVISKIMLIFGGLIAVSALAGKNAIKAGTMLILMAGAMLIMTIVIAVLKHMSPDGLDQAMDVIKQLGIIFGGLIAVSKLATDAKGTIIALTIAVVLMGVMLIALSFIEKDKLATATAALTAVVGIFALLIKAVGELEKGKSNFKKVVGTVVILLAVVGVLALIVWALSKTEAGSTIESAASMSLLLLALVKAVTILSEAKGVKPGVLKTVGIMTAVTLALGIILGALSVAVAKFSNPAVLLASTVAISVLLGALATACVILGKVGPNAATALPVVGVMTAVVLGLAVILGILSSVISTFSNVETLAASSASLSVLLEALATACVILGKVGPNATLALPVIGVMTLVTLALGVILGILASKVTNVNALIPTAVSLSVLVVALSAACVLLGVAGKAAGPALAGVGVLSVLVGALAVLIAGLGALVTKFPELETFIDKGLPILGKLGTGLGSFVGNIISSLADAAMKSLSSLGKHLGLFWMNIQPFILGVKAIGKDTIASVGHLATAILKITAADVLEQITSFITGGNSMSEFGNMLGDFGVGLATFARNTATIDPGKVSKAAEAGKLIAEMAEAIPNEGGLVSWITGDNKMSDFGTQLGEFGTALSTFSRNVATVDTTQVSNAAKAADEVIAVSKKIPNEGGLVSWLTGDNKMTDFGAQLGDFGTALSTFSRNVATVDTTQVSNAAKAATEVIDMSKKIPNEGGLVSWVTGDNTMADFGAQLGDFGTALSTFQRNTSTLEEGKVINATKCADAVIEMAKSIPNEGGLISKVTGDNDLSKFGNALVNFAKKIVTYSDTVKNVDNAKLASTTKQFKGLVQIVSSLDGVDSIGLKSFVKALDGLGKDGVNKFIEAFDKSHTKAKNAITSFIDSVSKAKGTDGEQFYKIGQTMVKEFADGMNDKETNAKTKFTDILSNIGNAGKSIIIYNKFYNTGIYLVQGLAAGIENSSWMAEAKARAVINATEQAAREAAEVNSPSKLFKRLGYSIPEGLAVGIDKMTYLATSSATNMVDTVSGGANKAISRIVDGINSNMNVQPTIRPVLDLSDVSSGANTIGRMLNMNPSIGVMSNVGAISAMMNTNQNGVNDDVISAINKLGSVISDMPRNTYNVNGVTYDDGSSIANAVQSIARAAIRERRI